MSRSIHDDDIHDDFLDDDLGDEGAASDGGEGWSRQTWSIIIAAVVIFGAIGGALVYFNSGEGTVTGVELTEPSRAEDLFTFAFVVHTDRGLANGQGTFTVTHDGEVVLTKPVAVSGGGGRIDVRYSEYVVGNGEYFYKFIYGGMQDQTNWTLGTIDSTNVIVTSVRADASLTYPDGGKTGAVLFSANFFSDQPNGTYARAPPGSNITLTVKKNGVPAGPAVTRAVDGRTYYNENLTASLGPGTYTVDMVFTNQWVKSDSAIKTLTSSNVTYVHNKPTACVSPTVYHANNANNYNITASGACSSDDVAIIDYSWDFAIAGEPVVSSGATATEAHHFPSTPQTYTCTLFVTDGGIPGKGSETWQTSTVQFTVQVSFF